MSHQSEQMFAIRLLQDSSSQGYGNSFGFVRFIAWYLFVILLCIIPACCSYLRRRRNLAREANNPSSELHSAPISIRAEAEAQHYFTHFGETQRQYHGGQRVKIPPKLIQDALEKTTMEVKKEDLLRLRGESFRIATKATSQSSLETDDETGGKDSGIRNNNEENQIECKSSNDAEEAVEGDVEMGGIPPSLQTDDDDVCFEDIDDEPSHLQLPADTCTPNSNRIVPSACAICLCPYEIGDEVTWSPEESCLHAFHRNCIVSWLCKPRAEQQCPCCRQNFCTVVITSPTS